MREGLRNCTVEEVNISTSAVIVRFRSSDNASFFKDPEVVGEQIRADVEVICEHIWREVTQGERIDDVQAKGIAEGGHHAGSFLDIHPHVTST
jgi:hypothetical protein